MFDSLVFFAERGKSAARLIAIWLVASVPYVLLEAIRPIKSIRLGTLQPEAFGHLISNTDLVLHEQSFRATKSTKSSLDVFVIGDTSANSYVLRRYLDVLSQQRGVRVILVEGSFLRRCLHVVVRALSHLKLRLPFMSRVCCSSPRLEGLDGLGARNAVRSHIRLEPHEERTQMGRLEKFGICPESPIVCFAVRSNSYWTKQYGGGIRQEYAHRIEFESEFRNSDYTSYEPALQSLLSTGYQVVRMGDGGQSPLSFSHPLLFDYALSSIKSPEMDVYLFSLCSMGFFGGLSGITALASTFGKPAIVVNIRPFVRAALSTSWTVVLPSLLRNNKSELISLKEMLAVPSQVGSTYKRRGLRFVPNSPEEIRRSVEIATSVLEARSTTDDILNNDFVTKFWESYEERLPNYSIFPNGGVGSWRLREHFVPSDFGLEVSRPLLDPEFLQDNWEILDIS